MHLRHVSVRNVRSVASFLWYVDQEVDPDELAGWHVLLGDNGSGKTSVLRAIALALSGPKQAPALRQDWSSWLRRTCDLAEINLLFAPHEGWDVLAREAPAVRELEVHPDLLVSLLRTERGVDFAKEPGADIGLDPEFHVWSGEPGWFSASYGPYRRFSGGDERMEGLYQSHPRLARHLTVFGENVALSKATDWLQGLKFKALEANKDGKTDGGEAGRLLRYLFDFINDPRLLPHRTRIEDVTSDGVLFVDGNDNTVAVDDLSDGYRSVLSLAFELLRNLVAEFGADRVFGPDPTRVEVPGVVLIDEVDAHLHPLWQRRIGHWFTERFPCMQFIVTTHSPLVCQAAEHGTIYRLPRPGSDDEGGFVRGQERERLLFGNVLDAYETRSFGVVPTRSDAGHHKLQRLAELNLKARSGPLDSHEQQEREHLRMILPTMSRRETAP
ncbi:MAG: AAA family ATPase [Nannocystaceae bacterium]